MKYKKVPKTLLFGRYSGHGAAIRKPVRSKTFHYRVLEETDEREKQAIILKEARE